MLLWLCLIKVFYGGGAESTSDYEFGAGIRKRKAPELPEENGAENGTGSDAGSGTRMGRTGGSAEGSAEGNTGEIAEGSTGGSAEGSATTESAAEKETEVKIDDLFLFHLDLKRRELGHEPDLTYQIGPGGAGGGGGGGGERGGGGGGVGSDKIDPNGCHQARSFGAFADDDDDEDWIIEISESPSPTAFPSSKRIHDVKPHPEFMRPFQPLPPHGELNH